LTKEKHKKGKKSEKYYLLFFLIPIITIFYAYQTDNLYNKKDYFKTEYRMIDGTTQFAVLPENPFFDIVEIKPGKNTNIFYRNLANDSIKQFELYDRNISSAINFPTSLCYLSESKNEIYTILMNANADYFLYKFYDKENKFEQESYKIFHFELYDVLKYLTITINDLKFYRIESDDFKTGICKIKRYKDGYKIVFQKSILDSLYKYSYSDIEINTFFQTVSSKISGVIKNDFSEIDLYELIQFFLRNSTFQDNFFSQTSEDYVGFLGAKIVEEISANNDNRKELLIKITGYRWIPSLLICYDISNEKVLWKKEFLNDIVDFRISDIDNDGLEEIMFSSYAPCYNEPVEKFKKEYYGSVFKSNFFILNNKGNVKIINNKPVQIEAKRGMYQFRYIYLKERNKILLGLSSKYDNSLKNFLSFDFEKNEIDSLNITNNHLLSLYEEKSSIIAINQTKDALEKFYLNKDFKLKKRKMMEKSLLYGEFLPNCLEVNNRKYSIVNSNLILDDKFNLVYHS